MITPEPMRQMLGLALRGATLVSRFLLIFALAKLLEPAEVGVFGLLTVTISYALLVLGFDFHMHAVRNLVASDRANWSALLRDQCVFYGLAYLVLMPFGLLLFSMELLPWTLALWFFPLLVLEHIAQEFHRVLIGISEPLWASVVLFLRWGIWALVAVPWMWLDPAQRRLDFVLLAWLVGAAGACVLAASRLHGLNRTALARAVDWTWIWRGARVAIPFLVGSLSLRAINTIDRYWIEGLGGLEVLAAYVLFGGMGNAVTSLLEATVFSFIGPALMGAANRGDRQAFDELMRRLARQTLVVTVVLACVVLVIAPPLLGWLQHPVYVEHLPLLYWTMLAVALSALGVIPQYGLYVRGMDRPLILGHLFALPVFAGAAWCLEGRLREAAIPAAMAFAFLFLLLVKWGALRRCGPLPTVREPDSIASA
ncbi:MAG: hypothetical protein J0M28_07220 [Thauera sp.]|nr:hypothetical protein [Thauera sp.]